MLKYCAYLMMGILLLPAAVRAGTMSVSGYTEAGKRSTAEDYEEEDTDDNYTYRNHHLKLKHEVTKKWYYDASTFIYDKDYQLGNTLDNRSQIFKTNWAYDTKNDTKRSIKTGLHLQYKEKRFDEKPLNEYDQVMVSPSISFKKKDVYTGKLTLGINNFDYLKATQKDEVKLFAKITGTRYLLKKDLVVFGSYKAESIQRTKQNKEKNKHDITGGLKYTFDLPVIYKITSKAYWGQRDTKEDDVRDEDLDYEYWRYYVRTDHAIKKGLRTNIKYKYLKKDYLVGNLDHRGFYISNGWDYELVKKGKDSVMLELDAEHKDVAYALIPGNNYEKDTAIVKATYKRKKVWKTAISFEGNIYDFEDPGNDKKRYYSRLTNEKIWQDGNLTLLLDLKFKYTDHDRKPDEDQQAARLAFKYRF